MKSAYNETWLQNLLLVKEVRHWYKNQLISVEQLASISVAYPTSFFHPNVIIRILLFLATLLALAGATGMLSLFVLSLTEGVETIISIFCILYGIASFVFLEAIFIGNAKHYKSGVTEALLYHAIGFTLGGIAGLTDFNQHVIIVSCLLGFSFNAFRYLDLISTAAAVLSFAYFVFFEMYEAGGIMQQIIPIVLMVLFVPLYLLLKSQKTKSANELWQDCLTLAEALSLLIIYAAGNYLVVRELSVSMMGMSVEVGQDIPFAFLFYLLTVAIPIVYIYFGIKNKDIVLIRVSLFALAFSVFTFKYYYSTGHPEITLTVAGTVLLTVTILLIRYLKTPQHGFTRESILSSKWANANLGAFVISQTMGGNQTVHTPDHGGGGSSTGGGSSDAF